MEKLVTFLSSPNMFHTLLVTKNINSWVLDTLPRNAVFYTKYFPILLVCSLNWQSNAMYARRIFHVQAGENHFLLNTFRVWCYLHQYFTKLVIERQRQLYFLYQLIQLIIMNHKLFYLYSLTYVTYVTFTSTFDLFVFNFFNYWR